MDLARLTKMSQAVFALGLTQGLASRPVTVTILEEKHFPGLGPYLLTPGIPWFLEIVIVNCHSMSSCYIATGGGGRGFIYDSVFHYIKAKNVQHLFM